MKHEKENDIIVFLLLVSSLTHKHSERPKQAWRFWKYFSNISIFWNSSEGEMFIRTKQQLFFKYFVNFHLNPKLFSKVWE